MGAVTEFKLKPKEKQEPKPEVVPWYKCGECGNDLFVVHTDMTITCANVSCMKRYELEENPF